MSAVGLRQKIETTPSFTPDIADYGDEEDFGQVDVTDGSRVAARGTRTNLERLWDRHGQPRDILKGARNYYLGKRRINPETGKQERIFFERSPVPFKEKVEGIDFLTCEVCLLKCELPAGNRVPENRRARALKLEHGRHMFTCHRFDALLYVDDEILNAIKDVRATRGGM